MSNPLTGDTTVWPFALTVTCAFPRTGAFSVLSLSVPFTLTLSPAATFSLLSIKMAFSPSEIRNPSFFLPNTTPSMVYSVLVLPSDNISAMDGAVVPSLLSPEGFLSLLQAANNERENESINMTIRHNKTFFFINVPPIIYFISIVLRVKHLLFDFQLRKRQNAPQP